MSALQRPQERRFDGELRRLPHAVPVAEVDGAAGAQFLATLKGLIEEPEGLFA